MTNRVTVTRDGKEVDVDRTVTVRLGDKVLAEDWDWDSLGYDEAEVMEASYGATLAQLRADVTRGSKTAERVLVWTLLKRQDPKLPLSDVKMAIGALTVELTDVDVPAGAPDPTPAAANADEPSPNAVPAT